MKQEKEPPLAVVVYDSTMLEEVPLALTPPGEVDAITARRNYLKREMCMRGTWVVLCCVFFIWLSLYLDEEDS